MRRHERKFECQGLRGDPRMRGLGERNLVIRTRARRSTTFVLYAAAAATRKPLRGQNRAVSARGARAIVPRSLGVRVPHVVHGLPGPVLVFLPSAQVLALLGDELAVGAIERGFVGARGEAEVAARRDSRATRLPRDLERRLGEVRGPDFLRGGAADGDRLVRRIRDRVLGMERRDEVRSGSCS